jgi:hypothetical protein
VERPRPIPELEYRQAVRDLRLDSLQERRPQRESGQQELALDSLPKRRLVPFQRWLLPRPGG